MKLSNFAENIEIFGTDFLNKNQQIKLQGCFIYQNKGNFSGFTLKQITKLWIKFKTSIYVNKVVLKLSNFAEKIEIFGTDFLNKNQQIKLQGCFIYHNKGNFRYNNFTSTIYNDNHYQVLEHKLMIL